MSVWLANEPLLRPDFPAIFDATKEKLGDVFDVSSFPTTGIPIALREDWRDVLSAQERRGRARYCSPYTDRGRRADYVAPDCAMRAKDVARGNQICKM